MPYKVQYLHFRYLKFLVTLPWNLHSLKYRINDLAAPPEALHPVMYLEPFVAAPRFSKVKESVLSCWRDVICDVKSGVTFIVPWNNIFIGCLAIQNSKSPFLIEDVGASSASLWPFGMVSENVTRTQRLVVGDQPNDRG